jgi:hypothetical protein
MRDNHRVDSNDINLKHSSPMSQTVPKNKDTKKHPNHRMMKTSTG